MHDLIELGLLIPPETLEFHTEMFEQFALPPSLAIDTPDLALVVPPLRLKLILMVLPLRFKLGLELVDTLPQAHCFKVLLQTYLLQLTDNLYLLFKLFLQFLKLHIHILLVVLFRCR